MGRWYQLSSEILSVCVKRPEEGSLNRKRIYEGFRSVQFYYSEDSIAGFAGIVDNGVPYIADHHFIGHMHEFRRVIPWMDDDASGFG
jgi:hypothetical protein